MLSDPVVPTLTPVEQREMRASAGFHVASDMLRDYASMRNLALALHGPNSPQVATLDAMAARLRMARARALREMQAAAPRLRDPQAD